MADITPQEYQQKRDTVQAFAWDGDLSSVQSIISWILERFPGAQVNAKFSSAGIQLEITYGSQLKNLSKGEYLVVSPKFGFETMTADKFNAAYELSD